MGSAIGICYLTLTSVVFELGKWNLKGIFVKNLTLTSVVFEYAVPGEINATILFNINKCCI